MVDLNLPRAYGTRVRNALVASAESVNLRNLGGGGGAFYAGGTRLTELWVRFPPRKYRTRVNAELEPPKTA